MERKQPSLSDLEPFYQRQFDRAANTQAEHSKWLINTLYLLHSGAIAGVVARAPTNLLSSFSSSLVIFSIGLALAFIAGFVTWLNYYFALMGYSEIIAAIRSGTDISVSRKSVKRARLTQTIAFSFGAISLVLLIVGAYLTYSTLVRLSASTN